MVVLDLGDLFPTQTFLANSVISLQTYLTTANNETSAHVTGLHDN